jgi:hypothetical protein
MTSNSVVLVGSAAQRFIEEHDNFHDAEIVSISFLKANGTLKVELCGLYLCVAAKNNWKDSDTNATIFLDGVTGVKQSGEFCEYSVYRFSLSTENRMQLVSNIGGLLEASFDSLQVDVVFGSEQNTHL